MSGLKVRLQCHQLINRLDSDVLNEYLFEFIDLLGGVKEFLMDNMGNIECDELLDILQYIDRRHKNITEDISDNDSESIDSIELIDLPKDLIIKTTSYLEISEVKHLSQTCINLALACSSEINKVDIKCVGYRDLILNDRLIMERNGMNNLGTIYRLHSYYSINIPFQWNVNNPTNEAFPIEPSNRNIRGKCVSKIEKTELRFFPIDYRIRRINVLSTKKYRCSWYLMIKYFNIRTQKLWIVDIISFGCDNILDVISTMNKVFILNVLKNYVIPIHKSNDIFHEILNYENSFKIDSNFFRFYEQNGLKPDNIKEIYTNDNPNTRTKVLIFEINMSNDNNVKEFDVNKKLMEWKQLFKNQDKPFCLNVKKFWEYNYIMHQTKKRLGLM